MRFKDILEIATDFIFNNRALLISIWPFLTTTLL